MALQNWPFPFWRILYHDIGAEVPENMRRPVREGYIIYWALVIMLLWNFFCSSVMLGSKDSARVSSWFLSCEQHGPPLTRRAAWAPVAQETGPRHGMARRRLSAFWVCDGCNWSVSRCAGMSPHRFRACCVACQGL